MSTEMIFVVRALISSFLTRKHQAPHSRDCGMTIITSPPWGICCRSVGCAYGQQRVIAAVAAYLLVSNVTAGMAAKEQITVSVSAPRLWKGDIGNRLQ